MRWIIVLPTFFNLAGAFQADIRADTNRDGKVDIHGKSDVDGKHTWTESRGAIFLANIGDTNRRCSKLLTKDTPNDELDDCHDASDDVQRAPQYMAPIRTVPIPGLSASASGRVFIADSVARDLVRIFRKKGEGWKLLESTDYFDAEELRQGLQLGIDARDVRRPGGWDGRVIVHFSVTDRGLTSSDSVMLRVAPVLTHHHGQRVRTLISTDPAANKAFNKDMEDLAKVAKLDDPLLTLPSIPDGAPPDEDVWAQDFFEPGYMSMPGPNETITLRVMIRSTQDDRPTGRSVFTQLRNTGIGAVQYLGGPGGTINSMGNVETILPFKHNGKEYPAGRIIQGGDFPHVEFASVNRFFKAQETQHPILLDTSWLIVGHVDEFVQFLPVDSKRGWVMMVSDPILGLQMLRGEEYNGLGSYPAFSRKNETEDDNVPNLTISSLLQTENFTSNNEAWGLRIQENIKILKNATGISNDEIYRVPSLFHNVSGMVTEVFGFPSPGFNETLQANWPGVAAAYYPGLINGIVLNDGLYAAPKPWGPVVDGEDIFERVAREVYGAVGYNVTFVDAWTYHSLLGEIHCATNTLREIDSAWWPRTEENTGWNFKQFL